MKEQYIPPKTETINENIEFQPLMISGVKFTKPDGTPADSDVPGMDTGSGDLGPGESFAKPQLNTYPDDAYSDK